MFLKALAFVRDQIASLITVQTAAWTGSSILAAVATKTLVMPIIMEELKMAQPESNPVVVEAPLSSEHSHRDFHNLPKSLNKNFGDSKKAQSESAAVDKAGQTSEVASSGGTPTSEAVPSFGFSAPRTLASSESNKVKKQEEEKKDSLFVGGSSSASTSTDTSTSTSTSASTSTTEEAVTISVSFAASSQTVTEGTATATVTVSLSSASTNEITVPVTVGVASTAVNITDYTIATSTVTIAAGSTSGTLTVTLVDDALTELSKSLVLTLGTPSEGELVTASSTHTITLSDNDTSSLAIGTPVSVTEGGVATATVTLTGTAAYDITVSYYTTDSSALAATDYTARSATLTIPAGSTSGAINVNTINNSLDEAVRSFFITLSTPVGASLTTNTATVNINDDDFTPGVYAKASMGGDAMLLLTAGGGLKTSGSANINGWIFTPTDVSGYTTGVLDISAGNGTFCIIVTGNAAKCWGGNGNGSVGDGTTSNRTAPTQVTGLTSGVAQISAYSSLACAVLTDGAAKCWGNNTSGVLGDGTTNNSSTPVTVSGIDGVAADAIYIAAGTSRSCAVISDGTIRCWGANWLGDNTSNPSNTPVTVQGIASGATKVGVGYANSCALVNGGVKCWGWANYGVNGVYANAATPVDIAGLTTNVIDIAVGWTNACAVTTAGAVKCWGTNASGELGNGTSTDSATPVQVTGLTSGVTSISGISGSFCARLSTSEVKCWGDSSYGRQGNQKGPGHRFSPVDLTTLPANTTALQFGNFLCVLNNLGGVSCVGNNGQHGTMGNGTWSNAVTFQNVTGLASGVSKLASTTHTICALLTDKTVKCWGYSNIGQVGDGATTSRNVPVAVSGITDAIDIYAYKSGHGFCVILNDKTVKCWGSNDQYQLGDGTNTNRSAPVAVVGLADVSKLALSTSGACALLTDQTVKCWGLGNSGQIGDGTNNNRTSPTQVSGLGVSSGVVDITAGSNHYCVRFNSGAMKCWGNGGYGNLGQGANTNSNVPITPTGLGSGVSGIAAAGTISCALLTTGPVKCWGSSWTCGNPIGNGDTTCALKNTPQQVSGITAGVTEIQSHTTAITAKLEDGTWKFWGAVGTDAAVPDGFNSRVPNFVAP